jgi:uncharacterized RDD family membrane protein YckC
MTEEPRKRTRFGLGLLLAFAAFPLVNLVTTVLFMRDADARPDPVPPSRAPAASPGARAAAALVDFGLVYALFLIPLVGWILALLLGLFRDSLFPGGRSLGKRLMGLRVSPGDEGRLDPALSFKRNALVGLPLIQIVGIPLEGVVFLATGRRLGDRWAGTSVVRNEYQTGVEVQKGH